MRIIVYDGGEASKRLKTIFAELGHEVYFQSGASGRLISEINYLKPFAVIMGPDLQDADALLFITRAKKYVSGFEPLFFVIDVDNDLRLCNVLRKAGYDNVYYRTVNVRQVAESIIEYCAFASYGVSEYPIHLSKTMFKKYIRSLLKKAHFCEGDIGFRYVSEAVYLLASNSVGPRLNVIDKVAEKYNVAKHTVYQNIRYAISTAWRIQSKCYRHNVLSDFAEVPTPKVALYHISNVVAEEVARAEMNIFDNFSYGNDD